MKDASKYGDAQLRILASWEEFSQIEADWRQLHAESEGHLFSSYDWLEIQENVFPHDLTTNIATLWVGDVLVSAVPLSKEKMRISKLLKFYKPDALKFLHCQYSGYVDVIAKDEAAGAALAKALCKQSGKTNLHLDMVVKRGETSTFMDGLEDAGFAIVQRPNFDSILINGEQTYASYLSQRSASFRKSVRRAMRALETAQVSFETVDSLDPTAIQRIMDVSRRSWKHAAGSGVAATPQNAEFVQRMVSHGGGEITSTVGFLKGPEKDIAFVVMLHFRRTVYGIWVEFDEASEKLSPGRSIVAKVLDHLFTQGSATTIDFMRKTHFTGPFAEAEYAIDQFYAFPKFGPSHLLFVCDSAARTTLQNFKEGRRKTTRRSDVKKMVGSKALNK